jgi:hypothetical protein
MLKSEHARELEAEGEDVVVGRNVGLGGVLCVKVYL